MAVTELRVPTSGPESIGHAAAPTFRDLLRERLDVTDEANPGLVADELLDVLSEGLPVEFDSLREAARLGLRAAARDLVRPVRGVRHHKPNSAKWDGYAATVAERPDIFARRICVGVVEGEAVWKFLGECDRHMLLAAADLKFVMAQGTISEGERIKKLSERLRGKKLVSSLDPSVVEEILDA